MKKNMFQKWILSGLIGIGLFSSQQSWATGKETKKAFVLDDALRIEGAIEKPEAYFFLQRKSFDSQLNAETAPKFNGVQQIVSAVESEIFRDESSL
jgi:hypothetical protein